MLFRIPRLKHAIETTHRCTAQYIGRRIVVEPRPDGTIWRGEVEVFSLDGHGQTDRCYAWVEQRGGRSAPVMRLKIPPVMSAQAAVRAVLARQSLEGKVPAR